LPPPDVRHGARQIRPGHHRHPLAQMPDHDPGGVLRR
jgi:hypothetical protein